jgi:hypothetical protein
MHHSGGGGYLALSHYGGTEKEWEASNLCEFIKV